MLCMFKYILFFFIKQIKPIPRPEGDVASESSPQMFVATSTSTEITSPPPLPKLPPPPVPSLTSNTAPVTSNASTNNTSRTSTGNGKRGKDTDLLTHCNVCDMPGTSQNLVMLVHINTLNIYFFKQISNL